MSIRTRASLATDKQRAYISGLLRVRDVPEELRRQASRPDLTDGDCRRIIPRLLKCPEFEQEWDEEDLGPDQGVHQFDGGLGDGSFL